MPQMNDEYWDLVEQLVPDHGPADSEQGELVRAVLRLTAEFSRNGCGNWDNYFEALVQFARSKFADGTLDAGEAEHAQSVLERLRRYANNVATGRGAEYRQLCSDIDDEPLEKAAVQWCRRHPVPIPFEPATDDCAHD